MVQAAAETHADNQFAHPTGETERKFLEPCGFKQVNSSHYCSMQHVDSAGDVNVLFGCSGGCSQYRASVGSAPASANCRHKQGKRWAVYSSIQSFNQCFWSVAGQTSKKLQ